MLLVRISSCHMVICGQNKSLLNLLLFVDILLRNTHTRHNISASGILHSKHKQSSHQSACGDDAGGDINERKGHREQGTSSSNNNIIPRPGDVYIIRPSLAACTKHSKWLIHSLSLRWSTNNCLRCSFTTLTADLLFQPGSLLKSTQSKCYWRRRQHFLLSLPSLDSFLRWRGQNTRSTTTRQSIDLGRPSVCAH